MRFEPRNGRRTMLEPAKLPQSGWDNHLRMAIPQG
jgi:hypothetical protein